MTASACSSVDAGALTESLLLEPRLIGWHFGPASKVVPIEQLLYRELPKDITRGVDVGSDECSARSKRRNVPGTAIELVEEMDAVIKGFLSQNIVGHEQIAIERSGPDVTARLLRALALVEKHLPAIAKLLHRSIRAILLFDHPTLNSFAALQMHGMIFLNIRRGTSVLFFVDGFVHQGGHVIFSEATLERQAFFKVSPDESLGSISGRRDARTAYEALHGLYTECALLEAFRALAQADLEVAERNELAARTGFVLRRFRTDVRSMRGCANAVLSHQGELLLEYFAESLDQFESRTALDTSDYTGHADDFDLTVFLKRNPAWRPGGACFSRANS